MEKFTLTSEVIILDDNQINIRVYPSNTLISKYIASYSTISSKEDVQSYITNFITEMTPILFNDFQSMENVPSFIKEQFEL